MVEIRYDKISRTNTIKLTRGDDITLAIVLIDQNGNEYDLQEGDELIFSVKKDFRSKETVLCKHIYTKQLLISHEDTVGLDFGNYIYDVQLHFSSGQIFTVISPSKMIILPEVHNDH